MPASKNASTATTSASVRRARSPRAGARKIGTELLTASTPVSAVQPLANARNSNHERSRPAQRRRSAGGATTGSGWPAANAVLTTPIAIVRPRQPTNRYIGSMNNTPTLRTPRRLATRQQQQNRQADRQRIRQQARDGRDHGADAGGDRDRHVEHVVDHQRARGEQPRHDAEVLACDRERTAAARIRRDRLAIGEEHQQQDREDRQRDRHDQLRCRSPRAAAARSTRPPGRTPPKPARRSRAPGSPSAARSFRPPLLPYAAVVQIPIRATTSKAGPSCWPELPGICRHRHFQRAMPHVRAALLNSAGARKAWSDCCSALRGSRSA